jgi:hypothetical protein
MQKSKYDRFVITEDLMPPLPAETMKMIDEQEKTGRTIDRTLLLGIQDSILKGAFFVGCEWLWQLTGNGSVSAEIPHSHAFDEIIGFAGFNRNYPRDLGGEIEFHMEDEILILHKSCLIFVPRGVKHCPIVIKRIDTPIFMFEAANNNKYEKVL